MTRRRCIFRVMIQRLLLAILLLSTHTLSLRAAMVVNTAEQTSSGSLIACCPLCVPSPDQSAGCGCGCGELEQDDRVPTSPDDVPGVINPERWIPDPEPSQTHEAQTIERPYAAIASLCDDAPGHTEHNRFLARVGVWLN